MNQFSNHQADLNRLVSQLRIKIRPRYRNMSQPEGPEGRLKLLRATVTGLFKYERIELPYYRADEARGYAERLISEAMRHGDNHKETMEIANFWLIEKTLIHKLFKVLVPRYENFQSSFTALYKAPLNFPKHWNARSVLELKGNPFPPLIFDGSRNKNLISNILLDEARKEFRKTKKAEIVEKITLFEKQPKSTVADTKRNDDSSRAAAEVSEGEELLKCNASNNQDLKSTCSDPKIENISERDPIIS